MAREENITRAAKALHITQPTLSRQLAQLEHELGQSLFCREAGRPFLTQAGRLLKRRAEELLSLAAKAQEEIKAQADQVTGTISIGSAESASARIWLCTESDMIVFKACLNFCFHFRMTMLMKI